MKIEKKRVAKIRQKRLESELIALLSEVNGSDEFRRKWLSVALTYFHQLPWNAGAKLKDDHISIQENGGFVVVWKDQQYFIPH